MKKNPDVTILPYLFLELFIIIKYDNSTALLKFTDLCDAEWNEFLFSNFYQQLPILSCYIALIYSILFFFKFYPKLLNVEIPWID